MANVLLIYFVVIVAVTTAGTVFARRSDQSYSKRVLLASVLTVLPPTFGLFSPSLLSFVNEQFIQFEQWHFGYDVVLPILTFLFCFSCNFVVVFVSMCIAVWASPPKVVAAAPHL